MLTAMSTAMPTKQTFTACCCCCCCCFSYNSTDRKGSCVCVWMRWCCACVAAAATMKLIINYPASQPASQLHIPPCFHWPPTCLLLLRSISLRLAAFPGHASFIMLTSAWKFALNCLSRAACGVWRVACGVNFTANKRTLATYGIRDTHTEWIANSNRVDWRMP